MNLTPLPSGHTCRFPPSSLGVHLSEWAKLPRHAAAARSAQSTLVLDLRGFGAQSFLSLSSTSQDSAPMFKRQLGQSCVF